MKSSIYPRVKIQHIVRLFQLYSIAFGGALAAIAQQPNHKLLPESGLPIPDFFGFYAISAKGLEEIKPGQPPITLGGDIEFIYYSKSVQNAESLALLKIPSQNSRQPSPNSGGDFKGWGDFLKQSEENYQNANAALTGVPRGSIKLELRSKSLSAQPEMVRLVPSSVLAPGDYQISFIGMLGDSPIYRFSIPGESSGFSRVPDSSPPTSNRRIGPPIHAIKISDSDPTLLQTGEEPPPNLRTNTAWPVIQRAMNALGRKDAILRIEAYRTRFICKTWIDGEGFVDEQVTFYIKYPDQIRQEATYNLKKGVFNQTMVYSTGKISGFQNGKKFSPRAISLEALKQEAVLAGIENLRGLLENRYPTRLNDDVNIAGRLSPSVSVSALGNFDVTLIFDKDTGLISRRRMDKQDPSGKRVKSESTYSGYAREITSGLRLPRHMEGFANGELKYQADRLDFILLSDIPEVYFQDPSLLVPDVQISQ